jgi:hypothetical protein
MKISRRGLFASLLAVPSAMAAAPASPSVQFCFRKSRGFKAWTPIKFGVAVSVSKELLDDDMYRVLARGATPDAA